MSIFRRSGMTSLLQCSLVVAVSCIMWLLGCSTLAVVCLATWLFEVTSGVFGSLAVYLFHAHEQEHEEANAGSNGFQNHDTVVNDESATLPAPATNIADSEHVLQPKHKVFLSHSGTQKDFVEQLCIDLQRWDRYPFFDNLRGCLPIGMKFPNLILEAIDQCQVGVVILSEEFFTSKWPMLELHAMVQNYKKSNSRITIIPVFYGISVKDLKDLKNQERWKSKWKEMGGKDKRIHVEEWLECIRTLGSINGLVMKKEIGDVKLRKEIIEEVCQLIPCETKWDDSHVQGRQRLCKVLDAKIGEIDTTSKVPMVGLYGVGGIGKTTICKALCNELASKYKDLVCHIELGSKNELEMLQKALKKLTNIEHGIVDKLNDIKEGCAYLKKKVVTQPIFFALDNVQDTHKSIEAAQTYLKASYGPNSVVLVTSRTLDVLKKLNMKESQCLEMPELEEDEARSLFLDYTNISACNVNEINNVLVKQCIRRCHFIKSDGKSRHYHPLALKVLGQQLGVDCSSWEAQLTKIDTFNQLGDVEHPVFAIFQNSFDSLNSEQQLIFMDLALSLYDHGRVSPGVFTVLDILCVVYDETMGDMKDMLKLLKRKSMLDEIRLDEVTRIGMHDLWREFAVSVTSNIENSRNQQMVYQVDERRGALGRRGLCRENVERMYFRNWGWKGLDDLELDKFVNVTGLRLDVGIFMKDDMLDLDLSGLKQLRGLHVECPGLAVKGRGLGSLRNLRILMWQSSGTSLCFNEIGCLTNLQYLGLKDCKGFGVLDLTRLKLLKLVNIAQLPDLISVRGISSRMTNLQYFWIQSCESFQECPGLGEVYSLEEIIINRCGKLEELPSLGRLSNLQKLIIRRCKSLKGVPGLGDLVGLQTFDARGCGSLLTVPDVGRLTKLQHWNSVGCPVEGLPGLDGLIYLTSLHSSFDGIAGECTALSKLSALKRVSIFEYNWSNLWTSMQNLLMLETLHLEYCRGDNVIPDLQNLKSLKHVIIFNCAFTSLLGLSNLTALEALLVNCCDRLEVLPAFERLTNLTEISIKGCNNLRDWPRASNLCSLVFVSMDNPSLKKIVPNLGESRSLRHLVLIGEGCESILSMAFLSQLETLHIIENSTMQTLDLSNFCRLRGLKLSDCSALERMTCNTLLDVLVDVDVRHCEHLIEMPDLSFFSELEEVSVRDCTALRSLSCSKPLAALEDIMLVGCGSLLEESIDVRKFPKLARYKRVDSSSRFVEERQKRRFPERFLLRYYG